MNYNISNLLTLFRVGIIPIILIMILMKSSHSAWIAFILFCIAGISDFFDGYIALGCVIRGETSHYDYICSESARGLSDLANRLQLAVGYGILTTDTRDQAWERAAVDKRNKGRDTAIACLRMVEIRRRFTAQG